MAPLVTVLLPTHDRADVLGYAIRSVLWQSETDFELLIVGDGCTDATRDVVGEFADPRVRFIDLSKAPFSGYANRNIALRQARGHFVAYAQDDDLWLPDHVERLVSAMAEADVEWGYSRPLWCTTDGFLLPFAIDLGLADELRHFMTVTNHIPSCCVVHTRAALERVNYWPEDVQQTADWICWQRIIATSDCPPHYCPTATTIHFRAIWKQSDLPSVERLAEIARSATWWPADGRLAVDAGTPEQKVFFDALANDPTESADRMRTAVAVILDRLAWGAAYPWAVDDQPLRSKYAALQSEHAALLSKHDAVRSRHNALQSEHDALRSEHDALRSGHDTLRSDHNALRRRWRSRSALLHQLVSTLLRKLRAGSPKAHPTEKGG